MPLLLGSFTQGLFGGAQAVLGMYSTYQQIQGTQANQDAAANWLQTQKAQDEADKKAREAAGDAPIQPMSDGSTPTTPPSTPDTPPAPTGDGKVTQTALPPPDKAKPASATPPSEREVDLNKYAIWNPTNPTGTEALTSATANPGRQPDPLSTTALMTPPNTGGTVTPNPWPTLPNAPGAPAQTAQTTTPTPTPEAPRPPRNQVGEGPVIWTADQGMHHARVGETGFIWDPATGYKRFTWDGTQPPPPPVRGPAPPAASVAAGGVDESGRPVPTDPTAGISPPRSPPVPMASTNQPVGATIGLGGGTSAITNQPVGGAGGPSLLTRPSAITNQPVGGVGGVGAGPTAGGTPVQGGVPQASAQPPTVGQRIGSLLSQVNPIGTAHAEGAPAAPPVPAPAPAQAPPQAGPRAGVEPPAPAPAPAPAAAPAPPAQVADKNGIAVPTPVATHAEAPTGAAAASTPTQAGPVPVQGEAGKVAPGQATPSVQSATTSPAAAPPVSPKPWIDVQRNNPQVAQMIRNSVDKYGRNGVVSPEDAAAVGWRESHLNVRSAEDGYGSKGIMQVQPDTARQLERDMHLPPGTFDLDSPQGNMDAGVAYLAHLAVDQGFGPHSVQTNVAYMRGPGGAHEAFNDLNGFLRNNPIVARDIPTMYGPGFKFDLSQFNGGTSNPNYQPVTVQGAITAAQGGPDTWLPYITRTGPVDAGMTEKWRSAQNSLIYAALMNGHMDMVPHIIDFVAQQSHMGTLSNLAAADNALGSNNPEMAAQYIAKAHAFFPDGTFARVGVGKDGNVYVQQFDDGSKTAIGKPFQVTHDMLSQQMLLLHNPATYTQELQKYQLQNAQIAMVKAHGQYYEQLPGIAQAKQEGIAQRAADKIQSQQDLEQQREAARARENALNREHQEAMKGATAGSSAATDQRHVDTEINKDYEGGQPQANEVAATLPRQSHVDAILRRSEASGGAGLAGPLARETARDMVNGRGARLDRQTDKNGNSRDAVIGADGSIRGYLSTDMGDRIRGLAGSQKMPAAGGAAGPGKQTMGIGAGAGSQMAAMQGLNTNLSGQPMQPMQQPQQQAA